MAREHVQLTKRPKIPFCSEKLFFEKGAMRMTQYLNHNPKPSALVLDLRIAHDRWGSSSDPSINGHLHYPYDIDRSLNEAATDKIRKDRADYNNNPPSCVSFMPAITSTSGRLHSEFVCLLFLQPHRETERFFAASGVHLAQSTSGQFHFKRVASPHILNQKSATFSPSLQHCG